MTNKDLKNAYASIKLSEDAKRRIAEAVAAAPERKKPPRIAAIIRISRIAAVFAVALTLTVIFLPRILPVSNDASEGMSENAVQQAPSADGCYDNGADAPEGIYDDAEEALPELPEDNAADEAHPPTESEDSDAEEGIVEAPVDGAPPESNTAGSGIIPQSENITVTLTAAGGETTLTGAAAEELIAAIRSADFSYKGEPPQSQAIEITVSSPEWELRFSYYRDEEILTHGDMMACPIYLPIML